MMKATLPTIGKTRKINIIGHISGVPAKIDSGADSSAIWASNIHIDADGKLHFTLFGPGSEFYTGEEIIRQDFKVAQVASSSGHVQIRYRTHFSIRLGGKRIKTLMNLSDRSDNKFPILIGRRTISGKFLLDVRRGLAAGKRFKNTKLNAELKRNPYGFYQKYHSKNDKVS